jgi:hypothetical protein
MSKLDIGVGDEFPLEEGQPEGRGPGHHQGRGRRRHRHGRRGLLHLPLIVGVAIVAAMIGAGRIAPFATHAILAVCAIAIVLAVVAHFVHHRRWHRHAQ